MRIHKAANALPEMSPEDYATLRKDIEAHGLLSPVELVNGAIIDGRHRFKACSELGIEPDFVDAELSDMTPAEYVWSLNGARRHLTASQKAAVAVDLMPECKARAKKRQTGRPKKGEEKGGNNATNFKARDEAATIVGVSPRYVSDAETLKDESPELFEQVRSGEIPLPKAKKKVKQQQKQEEDLKAAEEAKEALSKDDGEETGIHLGDSFALLKDLPRECCPLIFTDPPYDRESLPMFYELGELAERILVEGGSLITFCGQYVLDEVINAVTDAFDIKFFWIACCLHTGGTAQMREYGIKVKWKPMLWFVKGNFRRDRETWVDDLIESREEKEHHPWQQSVIEATYFIEKLTSKGELVVDPFCGGGTTAAAAKLSGRQWWTADVNPVHVKEARKRLGGLSG